jgi:hypothetical protein
MDKGELSAAEWMPLPDYVAMHESGGYGMNGEVARWVAEEEGGAAAGRITYDRLEGPNTARGRGGKLYHVSRL